MKKIDRFLKKYGLIILCVVMGIVGFIGLVNATSSDWEFDKRCYYLILSLTLLYLVQKISGYKK